MIRAMPCLATMLALCGCGDQSMTQQSRYGTFTPAGLFANGSEAQPLPEGVVAEGDVGRAKEAATPPTVDTGLLARGRERYDIFCSPCHGLSGHGDGMVVQRGFPHPPSYDSDQLRKASAQHIFDVISNGYGVMYPFAARIEPHDRWAIVAYVRALQESQGVRAAEVPELRSRQP